MQVNTEFDTGHEDLIHDVAFNFYGNRMITCSSDQKLKVFNYDQTWILNDSWKAHDSAIVKVSWAHPEFGQVFCSSSFDRTIKVWEESKRWTEKAKLILKDTVQDIQFAPHHLGLVLASACGDGFVRIYEAMDPMNVSNWTLTDEFEISKKGQFCLSWCPSKTVEPMMAIGCGNVAKIFSCDSSSHWQPKQVLNGHGGIIRDIAWAPNMGSDGHVRIFKLSNAIEMVADFHDHQVDVWQVEWNITGTVLSSSADDGTVRLWRSLGSEWKQVATVGAEKDSLIR